MTIENSAADARRSESVTLFLILLLSRATCRVKSASVNVAEVVGATLVMTDRSSGAFALARMFGWVFASWPRPTGNLPPFHWQATTRNNATGNEFVIRIR